MLSISGAVLALEGLVQQASGTNKLLWIRSTFYNRSAESQFGSFAYRSNGAQYLNLVWPVTLGFWWALERARRGRRQTGHHLLLACVMAMVVGPVISLSRGALLVTVGNLVLSGLLFVAGGWRKRPWAQRVGLPLLLAAAVGGGWYVQSSGIAGRMKDLDQGFRAREEMARVGRRMAAEAPVFGTGPETLQPLYQLYKGAAEEYWPGQLHNDWLETRITFGWAGLGMILLGLGAVLAHWWLGTGEPVSWRWVAFVWLALAGCLVHARWDLPFQVYSIVLLFMIYCSILLGVRRAQA